MFENEIVHYLFDFGVSHVGFFWSEETEHSGLLDFKTL